MIQTQAITEIGQYPSEEDDYYYYGDTNVSYYPYKVFIDETADLQEGYYVRADYLTSYGKMFRDGKTASFDDVENFLKKVTHAKNCVGTYIPADQWTKELLSNGFYFTGEIGTLGVVKKINGSYVVENMFETEEFEEYCYRMRRWFMEGYIRRDSAVRDSNEVMIAYSILSTHYILLTGDTNYDIQNIIVFFKV